jgi:broad specificity phosphatase PhoE
MSMVEQILHRSLVTLLVLSYSCRSQGLSLQRDTSVSNGSSRYESHKRIVEDSHRDSGLSSCFPAQNPTVWTPHFERCSDVKQTSRRQAVRLAWTMASVTAQLSSRSAVAQAVNWDEEESKPNLDCLMDLAPHNRETHVRLYLCRHGQTENNRHGIIQGARINPTINPTGEQQAIRLGQALARLSQPPDTFFHSNLIRARDTARTAAAQVMDSHNQILIQEVPALSEIDFGPVLDGMSEAKYGAQLVGTYARWAMGDMDQRMVGGGESGREVKRQNRFFVLAFLAFFPPTPHT